VEIKQKQWEADERGTKMSHEREREREEEKEFQWEKEEHVAF